MAVIYCSLDEEISGALDRLTFYKERQIDTITITIIKEIEDHLFLLLKLKKECEAKND